MKKVIFITGSGTGIGKICADYLSSFNYKVYCTGRNPQLDGNTAYTMLKMDVHSDESVNTAIQHVLDKEGQIDILINNAGIGIAGAIEDTSIEEAKLQFETNFFGMVRVTNAVIPSMRQRRSGIVVNISSLGGLIGLPYQAYYSASKYAMEGFTEALRIELKPFGVKAVLVNPGDIRTDFTFNRQLAEKSANKSIYAKQMIKTIQIVEKEEQNGADPFVIAKLIKKVIEKKNPNVRYMAGKFGQVAPIAMKRFIPARMFENIISSFYLIKEDAVENN